MNKCNCDTFKGNGLHAAECAINQKSVNLILVEFMSIHGWTEQYSTWFINHAINNYDLKISDTDLEYEQFIEYELGLNVTPQLVEALVDYLGEPT